MKYHNITKDDMRNGDGLRVVLWVSGCNHHCKGCQNPITWNPDYGLEYDQKAEQEIFEQLNKDYVSGITISGGDPLHYNNMERVFAICKMVKNIYPKKTVWVYTGFKWEEIFEHMREFLTVINVLVDGEFEQDKADVNYPWAGSTNQRVIDVQSSLKSGKVVLYESH